MDFWNEAKGKEEAERTRRERIEDQLTEFARVKFQELTTSMESSVRESVKT